MSAAAGDRVLTRDGADDSRVSAAMVAEGWAAPSTTVLRGQTVLRLCTINPRTTFSEIEETIERMQRAASAAD